MTIKSNEIRHRFPPASGDVDTTFEDEFAQLLEKSSLGTANARAIQTLSGPDVVERVQDRIEQESGGKISAPADGDIDDVLLDLVRCATVADRPEEPAEAVCRRSVPFKASFLAQGCESRGTLVRMVVWLAEAKVFEHVRRDVAQSMFEMALHSHFAPDAVLTHLVHNTSLSCGVLSESRGEVPGSVLAGRANGGESLDLSTASTPEASACPDVVRTADGKNEEQSWAALKYPPELQPGVRTRTGTGRLHPRPVRMHHWLDELVVSIGHFALCWHGVNSRTRTQSNAGRSGAEAADFTPLAGTLLGLMHEGAQSSSVLASEVDQRFRLPDVTYADVCDAVRTLRERGLVHLVSRSRAEKRYVLTPAGMGAFRQWLVDVPGEDRGAVVLGLLSTTPFTAEQQDRLIVLSRVLRMDEYQTRALTKWMAETLVPISSSCRHILANLINAGWR